MRAIIGCYAGAIPTIERHRASWEKHFTAIDYISPHDSPLPYGYVMGTGGHVGDGNMDRTKFMLALASIGAEPVALLDYDAIVLGELPVEHGVIHSCEMFVDPIRGPYPWGHCPYTAYPGVWRTILEGIIKIPSDAWECPYGDRMFGRTAWECGIGWRMIPNSVTGRNTIEMADVPRVRAAIAKGAPCVHGVKSQAVYDAIFAP